MTGVVTVFGSPMSQPTRAVLWTCLLINLKVNFTPVNVGKGDHKTKEFLQMNPNAKFPVLTEENGFSLWESGAIMRYVVQKYGGSASIAQTLYPSDLHTRAKIDQWLDWKHTTLRVGGAGLVRRRVMSKTGNVKNHSMVWDLKEIPEEREARLLTEALGMIEEQLGKTKFIASNDGPSIADLALFTEIDQLRLLPDTEGPPFGCDLSKSHPRITQWADGIRAQPGYQEIHKGFLGGVKGVKKLRAESKL